MGSIITLSAFNWHGNIYTVVTVATAFIVVCRKLGINIVSVTYYD